RVLNFLAEEKIPKDTGDFRLMDRKVVEELKKLKEKSKYLRGLIAWLGYKQISLEYVREERLKGKSKYSLKKMINLALDGIVGFSYKPIRYITVLGGFISIISLLAFIILLSVYLKGLIDISSIYISGAIFLVGFHFLSLGVIGEYVAQIHKEVKNRPVYISKEER
ncbi:MAG: glycosyltransferase, partial [Candidatus Woesearchaeota archaeon]